MLHICLSSPCSTVESEAEGDSDILGVVFQRENLKIAQQYFQLVGGSASECDTIPGRQCMASCFFLLKQFDDVLLYLNSIKSYFYNDDTFNFNYAQVTWR